MTGERSGRQDLGSSRGRDEGGKEMEVGNKGRGGLQGDWLKLRLPNYEGDILWGTYIRQVQAVFRLYGCDDDMVRALNSLRLFGGTQCHFLLHYRTECQESMGNYVKLWRGGLGTMSWIRWPE